MTLHRYRLQRTRRINCSLSSVRGRRQGVASSDVVLARWRFRIGPSDRVRWQGILGDLIAMVVGFRLRHRRIGSHDVAEAIGLNEKAARLVLGVATRLLAFWVHCFLCLATRTIGLPEL